MLPEILIFTLIAIEWSCFYNDVRSVFLELTETEICKNWKEMNQLTETKTEKSWKLKLN